MKRWLLISLLVIGLLLLSTSCSEETPTAPEPYLSVTDQGAVSCIDTTIKELVIPDYINGIKVTSIADNGFRECKSLKSITSSENLTSIGEYAFTDCSALEEINIHKTEDSISGLLGVHPMLLLNGKLSSASPMKRSRAKIIL